MTADLLLLSLSVKIELGVVSVGVVIKTMLAGDLARGEHVDGEKKRA